MFNYHYFLASFVCFSQTYKTKTYFINDHPVYRQYFKQVFYFKLLDGCPINLELCTNGESFEPKLQRILNIVRNTPIYTICHFVVVLPCYGPLNLLTTNKNKTRFNSPQHRKAPDLEVFCLFFARDLSNFEGLIIKIDFDKI